MLEGALPSPDDYRVRPLFDTRGVTNASRGVQHVWNLIERASRATGAEAFLRQGQSQLTNVSSLLEGLISRFRNTFSGMEFDLQTDGEILIEADPGLVEEAINNLLQNAASFAEADSTIETSLTRNGAYAEISILNEGPQVEGDIEQLYTF